jgi:copper transporter 1
VRTSSAADAPYIPLRLTLPRVHRNTQIEDTCIVFRQWHISSSFVFAISCLVVIFISLGYEYIRAYQRNVDRRIALALCRGKARGSGAVSGRTSPGPSGEDVEGAGLLSGSPKKLSALYVSALTPLRTPRPQ